jgi:hypothetical protein
MATLMEGVEPKTLELVLLIKATMVELTTLVVMLDTTCGNIPSVNIV